MRSVQKFFVGALLAASFGFPTPNYGASAGPDLIGDCQEIKFDQDEFSGDWYACRLSEMTIIIFSDATIVVAGCKYDCSRMTDPVEVH